MPVDARGPDAIAFCIRLIWAMREVVIASTIRCLLHKKLRDAIAYCIEIMVMQHMYYNGYCSMQQTVLHHSRFDAI